ncbi:hypothetical protein ACQP0C_31035 [Nocardia sp. CA-129566]|uniref:hypothetical protein n=1 Tax=Nocardia sp. CA-129566 TaxID=3239976 RepID=UPI003D97A1E2
MDQATIALLGAAIGAISAIAGSVITNLVAVRNEAARQEENRRTTYIAALRKEAAAVFVEFYAFFGAIEDVCFFAKNDPTVVDDARTKRYHDVTAEINPRMMAAMAIVAGLNATVYDELRPISRSLQRLDDTVCDGIRDLRSDRDGAIAVLAACHAKLVELDDSIPQKITAIMNAAERAVQGT